MLLSLSDYVLMRVVYLSCKLVSSGQVAQVNRTLNGITQRSATWTGTTVNFVA